MRTINRYLTKQLVAFFIMLLLILAGLAWMIQILTMLKFLITYGISLWDFLGLTSMMFPFIVSIILPFVIFIATLFIYNKLVSDNEVTVMAATGLSPWQISKPALRLGLIIAIIHWILNLAIVPTTQVQFYNTQWEMRYGLAHLKLQESAFTKITDGLTVFVDQVKDHDLSQLMLFDNRNQKQQMTILAEKGKLVNTTRGLSIVMTNGSLQVSGETFTIGTFDSYEMDMNVSDKNMDEQFKTRRIPTRDLIEYIKTPDTFTKKQYNMLLGETASRFLAPLMDILLVLIGMVILMKSSLLRRRASMAAPMAVLGMATAMSLYMSVSNMITSIAGLYAFAGAIVLAVIAFIFGLRK